MFTCQKRPIIYQKRLNVYVSKETYSTVRDAHEMYVKHVGVVVLVVLYSTYILRVLAVVVVVVAVVVEMLTKCM